jgi:hypothetical protein
VANSSITQCEIIDIAPVFYDNVGGWNLISLPVTPTSDGRKVTIYPKAISAAFGYNTFGYYIADTLKNRKGYWLKFPAAQHVPIDGLVRLNDTLPVVFGWNLIGSISKAVAIGAITRVPSNVVGNTFYSYSSTAGYRVADSIRSGQGYWVKANQSGSLILTGSEMAPKNATANPLDGLNTLTVRDRTGMEEVLYFGRATDRDVDEDEYALPPLPPEQILDARFSSGSMVRIFESGTEDATINLRSASYPVTVSWHIVQAGFPACAFVDPASGRQLGVTRGASDGMVTLNDPAQSTLRLTGSPGAAVPKEFSLKQNYPNPFNPSTTIAFDLPVNAEVTLAIYNLLGQLVATLIDHQQMTGESHTVTFTASSLPSGMYFYRLSAAGSDRQKFEQVKKLLLVK